MKIWTSLALNPGLRRNERVMYVHLSLILFFLMGSVCFIIGEFTKLEKNKSNLVKGIYACTGALMCVLNVLSLMVMLYLVNGFTS